MALQSPGEREVAVLYRGAPKRLRELAKRDGKEPAEWLVWWLAQYPTHEAAAIAAGVSRRTMSDWLARLNIRAVRRGRKGGGKDSA